MRDPNKLRVVDVALDLAEEAFHAGRRTASRLPIGLVAQMQRAAVSIGSNISEGCGLSIERQFHAFLQIAMGSASELDFQIRVAKRCLADSTTFDRMEALNLSVRRMLVKLTKTVVEEMNHGAHAQSKEMPSALAHQHAARSAAAPTDLRRAPVDRQSRHP
jgi:four helix bundle protein